MPSISPDHSMHPWHFVPEYNGRPHLGQTGGIIIGNDFRQLLQMCSPSFPQPRHHRGNIKSNAALFILVKGGSTFAIGYLLLPERFRYCDRGRELCSEPLIIGSLI